jgi:hypothetical protein
LIISFSDVGHIVNNDVNHLLKDQVLFQVQFSQTSCPTSRSRLQLTITGTRPMAVHNFIMAVDQPDYQALNHLGTGATKSTYTGRTAVANIEDATITVLKPEGVQNDNWKVLVTLPLTTWLSFHSQQRNLT